VDHPDAAGSQPRQQLCKKAFAPLHRNMLKHDKRMDEVVGALLSTRLRKALTW
jgi:hypothetical protein